MPSKRGARNGSHRVGRPLGTKKLKRARVLSVTLEMTHIKFVRAWQAAHGQKTWATALRDILRLMGDRFAEAKSEKSKSQTTL